MNVKRQLKIAAVAALSWGLLWGLGIASWLHPPLWVTALVSVPVGFFAPFLLDYWWLRRAKKQWLRKVEGNGYHGR